MNIPLRTLFALSLGAAAGCAEASLVSYATQASFLAVSAQTAVDTFTTGLGSPGAVNYGLTRTIGAYSYHAYAPTAPGGYSSKSATSVAGTSANPSLSGYYYGVPLVLDSFQSSTPGASVMAIGGNFYDSNSSLRAVTGSITVTALDLDGTSSLLTLTASSSTFLGFVSTTGLQSLTITPMSGYLATVDNLTLGTAKVAASVPEPSTVALVLAAVGAALVTRRSRQPGR